MLIRLWLYKKSLQVNSSVGLSRQKKLDTDPKVIQQIEIVGQLNKLHAEDNGTDAGNDQSMFVLTILEKIRKTRLKFSSRNTTVF